MELLKKDFASTGARNRTTVDGPRAGCKLAGGHDGRHLLWFFDTWVAIEISRVESMETKTGHRPFARPLLIESSRPAIFKSVLVCKRDIQVA